MKRFSNLMAAMVTVVLTGIPVIGCVGDGGPEPGNEAAEGALPEGAREGEAAAREVISEPGAFEITSEDESAGPELPNRQALSAPGQTNATCPVGKSCTFCGPQTNYCYLYTEGTRYSGEVKLQNGSCNCSSSTTWWSWSCDVTCL